MKPNLKKKLYCAISQSRRRRWPAFYQHFKERDLSSTSAETTDALLAQLFRHCQVNVPYYARIFRKAGVDFRQTPRLELPKLPILTKEIIRQEFQQLQSADLQQRKWFYNTSGGSTGEPVRFIQDRDFKDRARAVAFLYMSWAGWEIGEPYIKLWGSEKEIFNLSTGWETRATNWLTGVTLLNAFRMTPETMRRFLHVLNTQRPKLIEAYVQAIYELARFAERERIPVVPQAAVITSAGTLYPFMREKIEAVFGCDVYNRYGSREVGNIACQCGEKGVLHAVPWANYVEIIDEQGQHVPQGEEGNIVVTSLMNFAMPLIRYSIGDRGKLSTTRCPCGRTGQALESVLGRNVDVFKTSQGTLIDGEYFTHLLYFRDWVWKFQVVQESPHQIVYKVVPSSSGHPRKDLDEIVAKTRMVMGEDCKVNFEFLSDIEPSASGKYRYTISELQS